MSNESKKLETPLQNIITYLCFKANPNSMRKLMKLVYLVDVYHQEMFGERLTGVPFRHYDFGAFASDIYWTLEELYDVGILREEVVETRTGHRAVIPWPCVSETVIELPDSGFAALKAVIEDWGGASPEGVVRFTKRTLPFVGTPYGELIDFSRNDPVIEYARQHGVSEAEAATEDLLSNEELVSKVLNADQELRDGAPLLDELDVFAE